MELDRVAAGIVLESIKNAVPSRWTERVEALRQLTAQGSSCTLARYLEETDWKSMMCTRAERAGLTFVQTLALPISLVATRGGAPTGVRALAPCR